MYALVLAGAGGSPPLCRCDLRAATDLREVPYKLRARAGIEFSRIETHASSRLDPPIYTRTRTPDNL